MRLEMLGDGKERYSAIHIPEEMTDEYLEIDTT
jgi:hypothetical protein